jgi:hypothetical protein
MALRPAKAQPIKLIEDQADDRSYEDVLRELALATMVERGVADSDVGPNHLQRGHGSSNRVVAQVAWTAEAER